MRGGAKCEGGISSSPLTVGEAAKIRNGDGAEVSRLTR